MEVYIFGVILFFCVANFVFRRTVIDNVKKFSSEVAVVVEKNFYVDDALLSFSSNVLVIRVVVDFVEMLEYGGFYLMKFMFNSKEVLFLIFVERRVVLNLDVELNELLVERVFGVCWFVEIDELGF